MTTERRRLRISGQVQGVGFRWWAVHTATGLGLCGHVRNLPDGSVEAEAAGDAANLARFVDALRRGPTGARVSGVEELEPAGNPLPADFRVVR